MEVGIVNVKEMDRVGSRKTTLIECLRTRGYSGGDMRKMLRSGKVKVFGVPTADASRVVNEETVSIVPNAPRLVVGKEPAVIYRDRSLAVVWKPPRYLSVPAPGRKREPSVLGFVQRIFGVAFAVHRLDEVTSGLMMVALDEKDQYTLKNLLAKKKITRKYLAMVSGQINEPFEVRNILVRNRGDGLRGSVAEEDIDGQGGKDAATSFRPLEPLFNATLLEATLETGRTHQVRVHLAEEGFPILGEHLYASAQVERRAPRLCLHAHCLCFNHPRTCAPFEFKAPLADDLEALRRRLQLDKTRPRSQGRAMKNQKNKRA